MLLQIIVWADCSPYWALTIEKNPGGMEKVARSMQRAAVQRIFLKLVARI
jgi:hypothetical protein